MLEKEVNVLLDRRAKGKIQSNKVKTVIMLWLVLLRSRLVIIRYREDICLQTLLLLFKYANHKNKRSFVSTANEALVGTLMTIGDINNVFPIRNIANRTEGVLQLT